MTGELQMIEARVTVDVELDWPPGDAALDLLELVSYRLAAYAPLVSRRESGECRVELSPHGEQSHAIALVQEATGGRLVNVVSDLGP